jgi:hypothetical protein
MASFLVVAVVVGVIAWAATKDGKGDPAVIHTMSGSATLSGVTTAVAAEDLFKTAFKAALAAEYSVSATSIAIDTITETARRQRRLASLTIAYTITASNQAVATALAATTINTATLVTLTKASYTGTSSALSSMSITKVAAWVATKDNKDEDSATKDNKDKPTANEADSATTANEAWLGSAECAEDSVAAGTGGPDEHVVCAGCEQLASKMRAGKCLWNRNEWGMSGMGGGMARGSVPEMAMADAMPTSTAAASATQSSAPSTSAAAPDFSSTNNQVSSRLHV